MTRVFKSIVSTLVILSLIAVLPAKTTVKTDQIEFAIKKDGDGVVFASADVKKKKKKKGKKSKGGKGGKKKKGFFSKVFGNK